MNQSFYIGAVGAQMQLRRLNIIGDNIANLNTIGFKADRSDFAALMYQNHRGIEEELPMGVGTRLLMTSTNFSQGPVVDNQRSLDYMIEGDGFFALVDMATGEVSYTRKGAFTMSERLVDTGEVDEDGQPIQESVYCLGDGMGRFVLSEQGGLIEVTDPTEKLPIGIFDYAN